MSSIGSHRLGASSDNVPLPDAVGHAAEAAAPAEAGAPSSAGKAAELKATVFFQKIVVAGKCDPTISHEEALRRIENGGQIARQIVRNDASDQPPAASKENIRDLVWFMTAQSFEREGNSFPRGTTRVMDENSHLIADYMKSCPSSYSRASSHYNDIVVGKQYGINFQRGELPYAELQTVLFAKTERPEHDGVHDMFFKTETEGFCFTKDPVGAVKHGINWIGHIFSGGGETSVGGEETRRETDIKELKQSYRDLQKLAVKTSLLSKKEAKALKKGTSTNRLFVIKKKFEDLSPTIEERLSLRSSSDTDLSSVKSGKKEAAYIERLNRSIDSCRRELDELAEAFPENTDEFGHVRFGKESIIKLFDDPGASSSSSVDAGG